MESVAILGVVAWVFAAMNAWCLTLKFGGLFREKSKETLKSWKMFRGKGGTGKGGKYLRKLSKSCRPLFLGTEGYFIMGRLSILKFLRGIVKGTFRMLLTIK